MMTSAAKLEDQLAYWNKQLGGDLIPTQLLIERPLKKAGPLDRSDISWLASKELSLSIQSFSIQYGLSIETLLQGVWALLISHYSNRSDVLFGTSQLKYGEHISGMEGLGDVLLNILPSRIQMDPSEDTLSYFNRLQLQNIEMRQHENTSLTDIQKWTGVSPLFHHIFVFGSDSIDTIHNQDESLACIKKSLQSQDQEPYPLMVIALMFQEQLNVTLLFDVPVYQEHDLKRLLTHYELLLKNMLVGEKECALRLGYMSEKERHQLLYEWNNTHRNYPDRETIHSLFEAQVLKSPDAIAVVFEEESLTYKELNERANQLAHYLMKQGVGPDSLVAVCLDRSLDLIIVLLGILKAGGAYVPFDPGYPKQRIDYMLEDANPIILISTQLLYQDFALKASTNLVLLDDIQELVLTQEKSNPGANMLPEYLAYVIYTSGSTGNPKGVLVAHLSVVNFIFRNIEVLNLSSKDSVSQYYSSAFDAFAGEVWPALASGARLVIVPNETRIDLDALLSLIKTQCISVVDVPVPIFKPLLINNSDHFFNMRVLKTGGDKLVEIPELPEGVAVYNTYGPTETTIESTSYLLDSEAVARFKEGRSIIGTPYFNEQIYILDAYGNLKPSGIAGELCIGGKGLARGYLNRPDLTAEKFIVNLFSQEPGARLYKTGDLCRWLPDGTIEFLGRIDHQVKIRGFRIELGEIETALRNHEHVNECLVLAREDSPQEVRLVAYCIAKNSDLSGDHLRAYLKERLPDYMVPSAFVLLDFFPLNPNGKIDRKALPIPEIQSSVDYIAPSSAIEIQLALIWQEVLHVDRVGLCDDFIDLGGDSLSLMQVLTLLERKINHHLSRALFAKKRTLLEFSHGVEAVLHSANNDLSINKIKPETKQMSKSKSGDSTQMLSLFQSYYLQSEKAFTLIGMHQPFVIPFALRFKGVLDINALEGAINDIIERHMTLRLVYPPSPPKPSNLITSIVRYILSIPWLIKKLSVRSAHQLVEGSWKKEQPVRLLEKVHLSLQVEKISLQTESDIEHFLHDDALQLWISDYQRHTGIPIKARLFEINRDDYFLLVCLDHLSADGFSVQIFIDDLSSIYAIRSKTSLTASVLPDLITNWSDKVRKERASDMNFSEDEFKYWQDLAQKMMCIQQQKYSFYCGSWLPIGTKPTKIFEKKELALSSIKQLKNLAKNNNTSLIIIVLTHLAMTLAQYTQQKSILIYTYFANRDDLGERDVIGQYADYIPLVVEIDQLSMHELIQNIEYYIQQGINVSHIPTPLKIAKMMVGLKKEAPTGSPFLMPIITFDMQNVRDASIINTAGLCLEEYMIPESQLPTGLEFVLCKKGNTYTMGMSYSKEFYVGDKVSELFSNLIERLSG